MKGLQFCFILTVSITCLGACHSPVKKSSTENNRTAAIDSIGVRLGLISDALAVPVELNAPADSAHRMFITDNKGKIWIVKNDSLVAKPFFTTYCKPARPGENSPFGALFSVTFHPQFSTNGKFYVCYTAPTGIHANPCKLVVSQFTTGKNNPDVADLTSEHRILEMEGKNIGGNGAQIGFGPDGYLYVSIGDDKLGDSSYQYRAQNLKFFNGKLLRIDVNKTPYGIPADNPFINVKNARPEIWAYGFRKLWRFCFDPATRQLFGGDVGELKSEEVDIITKGANYGWPFEEGDSSFEKMEVADSSAVTAPINSYDHKTGNCIIGGSFYYGRRLPALDNKYVFGDFSGSLFALMKNTQGSWVRQPLKIWNKPASPFLICGLNTGENNELFVTGILNTKKGSQGVLYRIIPM